MPLKEIAGLTDTQLSQIYFRKRDRYGKLVRGKKKQRSVQKHWGTLPIVECDKTKAWQKSSLSGIFKKVWMERGLTEKEVEAKWKEYVNLPKNRSLKEKLAQNARARFGR